MKKIILLIIGILPLIAFAKDEKDYKQIFQDYKNTSCYSVDNNELVVSSSAKLSQVPDDILFSKLQSSLSALCTNSKSKIELIDKEKRIIVVKTFWDKIYTKHITFLGNIDALDAYCAIRVEVEGNELKVRASVSRLQVRVSATSYSDEPVFGGYPFTDKVFKSADKDDQAHSVVNLVDKMHLVVNQIVESIR